MNKPLVFCLSFTALWIGLITSSQAAERRCGWLQNPTPSNWWLVDRDGRWTISVQGGYSARGMETIPDMSRREYVTTNVNYGYACACLDVDTNRKAMRITRIYKGNQLPLKTCRQDPALPKE